MKKLTLEEVLEGIEYPRRENSVLYPLYVVLFIILIAVLCGATSYVRIEMLASSKEKWFRRHLKLENGIPKAKTYRYVLMRLEPSQLHFIFAEWMKCVATGLSGVVLKSLIMIVQASFILFYWVRFCRIAIKINKKHEVL